MKICKKCNTQFSTSIIVDGKRYGLYHRKFCLRCSPFKSHNTRDLNQFNKSVEITKDGKIYKICSVCKRELELNNTNYYIKSNGKYHAQCKECGKRLTLEKQRKLKSKCVDYKGGKCQFCGYNKYYGSLDFHHLDPSNKDFIISDGKCYNFEKLKIELDKCVLVCRNCHGELHGELHGGIIQLT